MRAVAQAEFELCDRACPFELAECAGPCQAPSCKDPHRCSTMRKMGTTPPPHERRIKRYDLRESVLFARLIAARPRSALLLAALLALIGLVLAMGWASPRAPARGFGPWFVAVLAWLLALLVAVLAVRALMGGGPGQN